MDIYTIAENSKTGAKEKIISYNDILYLYDENSVLKNLYYKYDCIDKYIKGRVFRHFKNKKYLALGIVIDKDSNPFVLYEALYGDFKRYIRPLDMFMSNKSKEYSDEQYPQEERFRSICYICDLLY